MIDKKIITGIVAAIGGSLCCITPAVAVLAGSTSFAATFYWMEPFRPWLIGLTIIALAYAWWDKLRPKKNDIECACEEDGKVSFWHTKLFLAIVTLFVTLMLSFPYWGAGLIKNNKPTVIFVQKANLVKSSIAIKGMSCGVCEATIDKVVSQVPGVINIKASAPNGDAVVVYDKRKTNIKNIIKAVASTGYVPTGYKKLKN